ncbi:Uncharacterised protein [Delftia tsuruhatensis]|nr:Uncharacterised protein [Delftia tsuruhatensis]
MHATHRFTPGLRFDRFWQYQTLTTTGAAHWSQLPLAPGPHDALDPNGAWWCSRRCAAVLLRRRWQAMHMPPQPARAARRGRRGARAARAAAGLAGGAVPPAGTGRASGAPLQGGQGGQGPQQALPACAQALDQGLRPVAVAVLAGRAVRAAHVLGLGDGDRVAGKRQARLPWPAGFARLAGHAFWRDRAMGLQRPGAAAQVRGRDVPARQPAGPVWRKPLPGGDRAEPGRRRPDLSCCMGMPGPARRQRVREGVHAEGNGRADPGKAAICPGACHPNRLHRFGGTSGTMRAGQSSRGPHCGPGNQ